MAVGKYRVKNQMAIGENRGGATKLALQRDALLKISIRGKEFHDLTQF